MRALAIAIALTLIASTTADARTHRPQARQAKKPAKSKKRPHKDVAVTQRPKPDAPKPEPQPIDPYADEDAPVTVTDDDDTAHQPPVVEKDDGGPQSYGWPWQGHLRNATKLHLGDGAYIRRPFRAYGTRSTVAFTKWAIEETRRAHPDAHVLAVGDISAEKGGWVSDHRSHQSGRDIDIGLFYKKKPPGYPNDFIDGTEANLDCATMWTMIERFTSTEHKDGGLWAIFLDFDVQGIIYRWAKKQGIPEAKLDHIFQYPHGRGVNAGLVRHYRNHAHHIHVRFKCTKAETGEGCN